jgi:uncharacterized protein (DUF2252 family)
MPQLVARPPLGAAFAHKRQKKGRGMIARTKRPSVEAGREERLNFGKHLRAAAPRSDHAKWDIRGPMDPLPLVGEWSAGRIAGLVVIRHGRMADSPLSFFRGSAVVMARDLAKTSVSGLRVQACNDAHLLNFGLFASPERNLLFDINDFDETLDGPWEWDLKRMAVSFVLTGREHGICGADCKDTISAAARAYRKSMLRYCGMSPLDIWYSRVNEKAVRKVFASDIRKAVDDRLDKAHANGPTQAQSWLVTNNGDRPKLADDPPLTRHAGHLLSRHKLVELLGHYRESLPEDHRQVFDRYELVDHVFKAVGLESIGTRCFVVYLSGPEGAPLFLQIKEATPSIIDRIGGCRWKGNQGRRTVLGQRLIQGTTDIFLGWSHDGGRDYYLRQFRDMKGTLAPEATSSEVLLDYAKLCGRTLARAHARSGDACSIAGYLGADNAFERALSKFAGAYASQVERDFDAFRKAASAGKFPTSKG